MFDLRYFMTRTEGPILPLHKKGDINEPNNYRGIILLRTFGKLFTHIINERLNLWADKYIVFISRHRQGLGKILVMCNSFYQSLLINLST